jgi:hypothetical protein
MQLRIRAQSGTCPRDCTPALNLNGQDDSPAPEDRLSDVTRPTLTIRESDGKSLREFRQTAARIHRASRVLNGGDLLPTVEETSKHVSTEQQHSTMTGLTEESSSGKDTVRQKVKN